MSTLADAAILLGRPQGLAAPTGPRARPPVVSNTVFAMFVVVATEVMFFTALISALLVTKGGAGVWAPPEGVRLPVAETAFNTLVLLLSGIAVLLAGRFSKPASLAVGIVTGAFFVLFQAAEWSRLVSYGMTMKSGIFGAIFYLLIGSHAAHAVAGVLALAWGFSMQTRGRLTADALTALRIFWLFVVCAWPVLYGLVYF